MTFCRVRIGPVVGASEGTAAMRVERQARAAITGVVSLCQPRKALAGAGRASWPFVIILLAVILSTVTPAAAQARQATNVWRSPQFGLSLSSPDGWQIVEQRSDPERGDVVILGNETSALLVGLLHDTRTPREMADDLVLAQKTTTPDLAVLQSEVTATGAVLMFMQYTIQPHTDGAMLIDEKALVGALQPGASTITVRGMVPDRANVEAEFAQIEAMIGTLQSDR